MPFSSPYAPYSGYGSRQGDDDSSNGRKRAPPGADGGAGPMPDGGGGPSPRSDPNPRGPAPTDYGPAPSPAGGPPTVYGQGQAPTANLTGGYVPLSNYLYAQQASRAPGQNGYGGQMTVAQGNPYAGTGAAQYDAAANQQRGIVDPAATPAPVDSAGGAGRDRDAPEGGGGARGGWGADPRGGGGLGGSDASPASPSSPSPSANGLDSSYSTSFPGGGGAAYRALLKWLDN